MDSTIPSWELADDDDYCKDDFIGRYCLSRQKKLQIIVNHIEISSNTLLVLVTLNPYNKNISEIPVAGMNQCQGRQTILMITAT